MLYSKLFEYEAASRTRSQFVNHELTQFFESQCTKTGGHSQAYSWMLFPRNSCGHAEKHWRQNQYWSVSRLQLPSPVPPAIYLIMVILIAMIPNGFVVSVAYTVIFLSFLSVLKLRNKIFPVPWKERKKNFEEEMGGEAHDGVLLCARECSSWPPSSLISYAKFSIFIRKKLMKKKRKKPEVKLETVFN